MKKTKFLTVMLFVFILVLTACGESNNTNSDQNNNAASANQTESASANDTTKSAKLKVGATSIPHAEILNFLVPMLQEQGVELEVIEFTDYVLPNTQLYEKELDANFFQHVPYLEKTNAERGYNLVNVAGVHIEPFGIYSNQIKDISELKDGAKIAIPNDPTNGGRSLLLLAKHGLIELAETAGVEVTVSEIKSNPHNFEFIELEAATLPRVLDEVAIAAINTNYALEAGFNPTEDALLIEDSTSPYVNVLVTRPDNKDDAAIAKLIEALQSPEVEAFINEKYNGAVVPAFNN